MKKSVPFAVAIMLLLFAACKRDDNSATTLKLTITPKWGTNDLQLQNAYAVNGGYMKFESFGMYLSHIKLVRTDNTEVEVDSALLLIYSAGSQTYNLKAVAGSYKAVKFGIGLDSVQNKISPSTVPDNDPVYANNLLYWDQNRKHLFVQMEGAAGTSANSLNSVFFYHIGFDSMYRSATVSKNFTISEGQPMTLDLRADVSQVFTGANGVNVITDPATHTSDYPAVAHKVADTFTQIFSLP